MNDATQRKERPIDLNGQAGPLEALATEAAEDRAGGVLLLHPHPLYGGNMHSKVIYTARKVFAGRGLATLRFNFRGVGLSAGVYDDGQGETDDALDALAALRRLAPAGPLYLAGFSFGAWLALKIGAAQSDVAGMLALGLPVDWAEFGFLAACGKPKLLVHGDRDQYCAPDRLRDLYPAFAEPKRLRWIAGADHFFLEHLPELSALLEAELPFILEMDAAD